MLLFQPDWLRSSELTELTDGAEAKALLEAVACSWPMLFAPLVELWPLFCQFNTVSGTT